MRLTASLRRIRVGMAISPECLTIIEQQKRFRRPRILRTWRRELAPAKVPGAVGPDLATALAAAAGDLNLEPGTVVDVAMLRPLAHAAVLTMPPVGRRALRCLLSVGAARFFAINDEAVSTDAARLAPRRLRCPVPTLTVAATTSLVADIEDALNSAGLELGRCTSGSIALCFALRSFHAGTRRHFRTGTHAHVAAAIWGTGGDLIFFDPASPSSLRLAPVAILPGRSLDRQLAGVAGTLALAVGLGRRAESILPICDRMTVALLGEALVHADIGAAEVLEPPEWMTLGADVVAASGVITQPARAPQLLSATCRTRRTRAAWRRRAAFAAVSAAMLVGTAALQMIGMRRELASIDAARQAVAPAVRKAAAARRTLDASVQVMTEVATSAAEERLSWPSTFARLTEALPDSAYLTQVDGIPGDLHLVGLARSALRVADALAGSRTVAHAVLTSPVRPPSGGGRERFAITLRMRVPADSHVQPLHSSGGSR